MEGRFGSPSHLNKLCDSAPCPSLSAIENANCKIVRSIVRIRSERSDT